jgi:hypothetical protein
MKTAVDVPVTAVSYISVVGGFINRGKLVCNRGIISISVVGGFINCGKLVCHRGIISLSVVGSFWTDGTTGISQMRSSQSKGNHRYFFLIQTIIVRDYRKTTSDFCSS